MNRNTISTLSEKKMEQIERSLNIYKQLIPLWKKVRKSGSRREIRQFLSLNRNPLFDITNIKYFQTGLMSSQAKKYITENVDVKLTHDHMIQRSKALEYIFNEIECNPDMSTAKYIRLLRRYCSTVVLTKEEHLNISTYGRLNPSYANIVLYNDLKINVQGLDKWVRKNKLVKVSQRQF